MRMRFGNSILGTDGIPTGARNTKSGPQIDPKSMKNHGCNADAFWEQHFGHQRGVRNTKLGPIRRPISTTNRKNDIRNGI